MQFPGWLTRTLRRRIVLVATVALVLLLLAHPELRLLAPVVDALGADMLLLLMASQLHEYLRPVLIQLGELSSPALMAAYALCIYGLGIVGPYVDGYLRTAVRQPAAAARPC